MRNKEKTLNHVNDIRPTSLRHFVGQRGVVDPAVALDACSAMDDALMVVGPAGLGRPDCRPGERNWSKCHEALGHRLRQRPERPLAGAKDREIVFIDETQRNFSGSSKLRIRHRPAMRPGVRHEVHQSISLADFTLVLGSIYEHALLPPSRQDEAAAAV